MHLNVDEIETLELTARRLRKRILNVAFDKGGHIGGSFSSLDLILVLYKKILKVDLKNPKWSQRDRFILSKGHCSLALYAVLEDVGFLEQGEFDTYTLKGSRLAGHVEDFKIPAIELSTGSLGHGLACAAGHALAGKLNNENWRVFCILGDGECNEGSVWESLLFISQQKLTNLIVIIDNNKMESLDKTDNILSIEPLYEKLISFNFDVKVVDGHDFKEIYASIYSTSGQEKPLIIIANTVKGKGVSFMENTSKWHYRAPSQVELLEAMAELN